MIVEMLAIVGAFGVTAFFIHRITSLIRIRMETRSKKSFNYQAISDMQKEYQLYKQKTEKRLQNIEAIVIDKEDVESKNGDTLNHFSPAIDKDIPNDGVDHTVKKSNKLNNRLR